MRGSSGGAARGARDTAEPPGSPQTADTIYHLFNTAHPVTHISSAQCVNCAVVLRAVMCFVTRERYLYEILSGIRILNH